MAQVSALDVAAFILQERYPRGMTTMKLQKLVYYSQAWSLVWDDEALFSETIEAWANGPVVRKLFTAHRGRFKLWKLPEGHPDRLSDTQKETVRAVIKFYGDESSQWLSDLTHAEEPWMNARVGLSEMSRSNSEINLGNMLEYYSSL